MQNCMMLKSSGIVDMNSKIDSIVRLVLSYEGLLSSSIRLEDLGCNSLTLITLIVAVEEELGRDISEEYLIPGMLDTLGQLYKAFEESN